jgi:alginate O-acetyltransferase complex protein AlgI
MLFTTAQFVLLFLPLTLLGFFMGGRYSRTAAAVWLFIASVVFYGYWMPVFTGLLLGSIGINFFIGLRIARSLGGANPARARLWLVLGITIDLVLLAYFKYANFFIDNLNMALGTDWHIGRVILPIGISFYTFTQIAFLADTYRAKVHEAKLVHYGLFVSYFPHLVAGPVLHHAQMMPQFANPAIYRFDSANFAAGLAIFAIGLVKKVVLADGVAPYADAVFNPVDGGLAPDRLEAWVGMVAYTFQIYFDFSGYSDMAIGLSWMFNIRLPFNFDSPYRATSISDFWRRWHISLSNFLRDYLYIALGGNRHGSARRYANLATTMVLGGLWHGASWSFVIWGALHGAFLMLNHAFRALCGKSLRESLDRSRWFALFGWASTILAVMLAWIFFRAETLPGALRMLQGLTGRLSADDLHTLLWNAGLHPSVGALWCSVLGLIAFVVPNSNRIGTVIRERARRSAFTRGAIGGMAAAAVLMLLVINTARDSVSAFIYFNF